MKLGFDRKLITEDGLEFYGVGFGAPGDRVCELVFNTSMAGYQEILSDPSYTNQAVVMTYPLIGNYGMAPEDYETDVPSLGAFVVREFCAEPSNFRSEMTLEAVMLKYGIPGIAGVDTRRLTRSIRDRGSRRALLTSAATSLGDGLALLRETPVPHDAVSRVSCRTLRVFPASGEERFHVVAIDCGMKRNIIRSLNGLGCRVTVVPWNTPAEDILAFSPDGVLVSNGPGDPEDVPETVAAVHSLLGRTPVFGICLGHQILALAYGASTYRLKFGHRGGNHPVRDLSTGKIEITSQNHSYAVDLRSLEGTRLRLSHQNLLDGTVEGLICPKDLAFSVQYHPESSPGPKDSAYLFRRFIGYMEEVRAHA